MSKLLILLSCCCALVVSCSTMMQANESEECRESVVSYQIDSGDCPEGEIAKAASDSAYDFPDTSGVSFFSSLQHTSGPHNYNSLLELDAPAGIPVSMFFYRVSIDIRQQTLQCVGKAFWEELAENEHLSLPLAVVYDTWGYDNYIAILVFDHEPQLKHFIRGEKEKVQPRRR